MSHLFDLLNDFITEQLSADFLRAAAGAPMGEPLPFALPAAANGLNTRQRELILHTIRVLFNE